MSPDTDQTVVDEEVGEGGGQSAGLHGGGAVSHCYISAPGSRTMICNVPTLYTSPLPENSAESRSNQRGNARWVAAGGSQCTLCELTSLFVITMQASRHSSHCVQPLIQICTSSGSWHSLINSYNNPTISTQRASHTLPQYNLHSFPVHMYV